MAMPSITLLVMDLFPTRRGMASSLAGFISGIVNAVVAGILSPAVSHSPRAMAISMLCLMLGGMANWFCYRRLSKHS